MESDAPYNFSWFVEGKIAGMGWPESTSELKYLAQSGIKAIVNLTEMTGYYERNANRLGIACYSVPVGDCCPPSREQIEKVLQYIREVTGSHGNNKEGGAIGIHCLQGLGRTGTMLASYLVAAEDYTANDAISETRHRRRYSIETRRQEQAVRDFERHVKSSK